MVIEDKLINGEMYWVRYDEHWNIARWDEKYQQFQFIGRTIYDLPHIIEIDYKPIKK